MQSSLVLSDGMFTRKTLKLVLINLLVLLAGILLLELIFGGWFNPNRLNKLDLVKDVELSFDVGELYQSVKWNRNRRRG